MLARRLIMAGGGSSFAIPTYSGSHAIFGDEKQGYIECYSTGTITFPKAGKVDVFVLGSGLKGNTGYVNESDVRGGNGGNGAVGTTSKSIEVTDGYSVTITVAATCSSTSTANKSSALGVSANSKASNGGSYGRVNYQTVYEPRKGTDGTSYPFGETSGIFFKKFGAGGGGGDAGCNWNGYYSTKTANGGTLGGGASKTAATANTGSGGGGGSAYNHYSNSGTSVDPDNNAGNGGSGIVIIRWGYAA